MSNIFDKISIITVKESKITLNFVYNSNKKEKLGIFKFIDMIRNCGTDMDIEIQKDNSICISPNLYMSSNKSIKFGEVIDMIETSDNIKITDKPNLKSIPESLRDYVLTPEERKKKADVGSILSKLESNKTTEYKYKHIRDIREEANANYKNDVFYIKIIIETDDVDICLYFSDDLHLQLILFELDEYAEFKLTTLNAMSHTLTKTFNSEETATYKVSVRCKY